MLIYCLKLWCLFGESRYPPLQPTAMSFFKSTGEWKPINSPHSPVGGKSPRESWSLSRLSQSPKEITPFTHWRPYPRGGKVMGSEKTPNGTFSPWPASSLKVEVVWNMDSRLSGSWNVFSSSKSDSLSKFGPLSRAPPIGKTSFCPCLAARLDF